MELVQISSVGHSAKNPVFRTRKPSWLKVKAPGGSNYVGIKSIMRDLQLHTVCEEAHCPNIGECWEHRTATFMILGDVCTRNCAYCAVAHGTPASYDESEPERLERLWQIVVGVKLQPDYAINGIAFRCKHENWN